LLYISGTGGDLRAKPGIFDSVLPSSFDLLAYDQRGLGRSERPPGPYSMQDYADDAAALLEAVGWERCRVLGVSFGGMVAQELALRHPHRVERMVLACTSPGGAGGSSYPLHELQDLPLEERARRMIALNDSRFAAMEVEKPERYARILQITLDGMKAAASWPDEAPGDNNVSPDEGARMQLEARRHHDVYDRLPDLSMPVLVACGRYDGIAPVSNSEAIASLVPGATLEVFEGGHLFMVQDRTAFPRMAEFLAG
jgi:3-oxoadipate enol-lactonase